MDRMIEGVKERGFLKNSPPKNQNPLDSELELLLSRQKAKIKVIGCGGGGNNTINRISEVGITGVETIAINTDAQDLLYTNAITKILIGKTTTQGLGAGSVPQVGEEAAKESEHEIKEKLQGADMVFITCGLGGGCLRGSSLIYTNPHGLVRIDSIKPGQHVYSLEYGSLSRKKVLASMKTGIKKVYEIKTKNKSLVASFDHPLLKIVPEKVDNKNKFYDFSFEWTNAEKLKINDLVVTLTKAPGIECTKINNMEKEDNLDILYEYKGSTASKFFNNFGFSKITKVSELSEEEVYDITVEGSHNFVSEGFITHNTGTGSAPVVAEVAKKLGALTVAIVTMPFEMEGQRRLENAMLGLERLENIVDTLIVIPNDKLLELAPDLPLHTAFKVADEILTNSVKGIAELVTKTGLINLDFADIRTVMGKGGVAMIGVGESDSENRAIEAVEKAINNPLLDVNIDGAVGALINIAGGPDMTLEEARKVVETVSSRLNQDAKIIWGAQISEDLVKTIRTMLIVTGVNSPQIFGPKKRLSQKNRKEIEAELGIEFIG